MDLQVEDPEPAAVPAGPLHPRVLRGWERLVNVDPSLTLDSLYRLRAGQGWLVVRRSGAEVAFVLDPEGTWDPERMEPELIAKAKGAQGR